MTHRNFEEQLSELLEREIECGTQLSDPLVELLADNAEAMAELEAEGLAMDVEQEAMLAKWRPESEEARSLGQAIFEEEQQAHRRKRRAKGAPALEAARRALACAFPRGIPDSAILRPTQLCDVIHPLMPFRVSDKTILRAAGRCR